jgi:hypothetical protein
MPDFEPDLPNRPDNWDLRVSAAYLRLLGLSQADAAAAVDRTDRCLRTWEAHPSWPEAQQEATARWLRHATNQARLAVTRGIIDGDLTTARWLLERVDPLFQKETDRTSNFPPHFIQHQVNQHLHIGTNGDTPTGGLDPIERGAAVIRVLLAATKGQPGALTGVDAEVDLLHSTHPDTEADGVPPSELS